MKNRQWLRFEEFERIGKFTTKTWKVFNAENGSMLGYVKWHGSWRQYCFFPYGDTVWNAACLHQMDEWLQEKMREHKAKKTKKCDACYHAHGVDCPVCGEKVKANA